MNLEILRLLKWGFHIVYIISVIFVVKLWLKDYKNKSYRWFYAQLFILYVGAQRFFKFIQLKPEIPQSAALEDNYLLLGVAGLYWAISMFFMIMRIRSLGKKELNN